MRMLLKCDKFLQDSNYTWRTSSRKEHVLIMLPEELLALASVATVHT